MTKPGDTYDESMVMEPRRKHITIKDMAEKERPREKFLEKGAEALTVSELLAVIIGQSRKPESHDGR